MIGVEDVAEGIADGQARFTHRNRRFAKGCIQLKPFGIGALPGVGIMIKGILKAENGQPGGRVCPDEPQAVPGGIAVNFRQYRIRNLTRRPIASRRRGGRSGKK